MSNSTSTLPILITEAEDIYLVLRMRLAATMITIYDHLVTFDREVAFIWASKWSLAKVLFLTNRYFGLSVAIMSNCEFYAIHFTDELFLQVSGLRKISSIITDVNYLLDEGSQFFHWEGWAGLIGCMLVEAILLLRLYALYFTKRKVVVLMLIVYLACSAASAWILGTTLSIERKGFHVVPTTAGLYCVSPIPPHVVNFFWIPIICCECLLCALAVFQGIRSFDFNVSIVHSGRHLIDVLIRDSVMYFILIGILYLTCLVSGIEKLDITWQAPLGFCASLACVLGSRLIFNIREAGTLNNGSHISSFFVQESIHFGSEGDPQEL